MPKESIQHLYNLPGPWGWEKMQTYRNEKLSPSPLTAYSADRLTAIGLVWIMISFQRNMLGLFGKSQSPLVQNLFGRHVWKTPQSEGGDSQKLGVGKALEREPVIRNRLIWWTFHFDGTAYHIFTPTWLPRCEFLDSDILMTSHKSLKSCVNSPCWKNKFVCVITQPSSASFNTPIGGILKPLPNIATPLPKSWLHQRHAALRSQRRG